MAKTQGHAFFPTLFLSIALLAPVSSSQSEWKIGRATAFGASPWNWNVHEGSCGYGYLWPHLSTGWDAVSVPDSVEDLDKTCGQCYEVACHPSVFRDGYGATVNRQTVCLDPTWSVVVRTTDACPCNSPNPGFDYKRWCCGDANHLSLSVWAFEKLAPLSSGSIGLKFRKVPCSYVPANPAPPAIDPTPGFHPPADAVRPPGLNKKPLRKPQLGFIDGFSKGWEDTSVKVKSKTPFKGSFGKSPLCYEILPGGAVSMKTKDGDFSSRLLLESNIWTKSGVPPVLVNIAGDKGPCAAVPLRDLANSGVKGGVSKYNIYLGVFDKAIQEVQLVEAFASIFKGCGGNQPSEVNTIIFENIEKYSVTFCLESVKLL